MTRIPSQKPARPLRFEPLEARALLDGSGLTGQYFNNSDFTAFAVEQTEAVNFVWGSDAPAPGVGADTFSVRWFGQVEANYSETYTFRITSDEAARLWIDGRLVIDAWDRHAARLDTGTAALTAGQRHDIRLEYFDISGSARMQLEWQSASQPLEIIPESQLYVSPPGLRGEYADAGGVKAIRYDGAVNFNWGASAPVLSVTADNFNVKWTGMLRPDFSERYEFSTISDEAVRVWVGGELVVDHWTPHTTAEAIGSKILEGGKWYDLRVEYRDVTGEAEVQLAWASERQTFGESQVITSANLQGSRAAPLTFTNPLGQGQDPYVVQWNGSYLLVRSGPNNSVWIDKATQLQDVHDSDPNSVSVRAWSAPPGTNYSQQVWAPELHRIGDKWYIYVAASDGDNATHRMHVLERDSADPMGPYTYMGQLAAPTDRWAIDGTVLQWEGLLYFIWSGWSGTTDGQQNIYIAPMSDPLTISGNRAILSTPSAAWERHGLPINEGPEVLVHDGKLHIIYSGSGYWTQEYALGRLTYDGSGSLLSAANWIKAPTPVFQKSGNVVGVGHASFVKSPDGTQDWIVYHSHPFAGGDPDQRVVRIQQFTWNADGTPNFGTPLPSSTVLAAPSGIAEASLPLLAGDYDDDGGVDGADFLAWQRSFDSQPTSAGGGADGDGDGIIDAGDLDVWARDFGFAGLNVPTPASVSAIATPLALAMINAEMLEPAIVPQHNFFPLQSLPFKSAGKDSPAIKDSSAIAVELARQAAAAVAEARNIWSLADGGRALPTRSAKETDAAVEITATSDSDPTALDAALGRFEPALSRALHWARSS